MSRNSKNARLHREAQERKGVKGPSKTVKKNKKVNVWWAKRAAVVAATPTAA